MIDLVALPVWVNTLIAQFHFDAQSAGALATVYLACAVLCSVCIAPLSARMPGRVTAPLGFALAACGFGLATQTVSFGAMLGAHALAGLGIGCGLSVAHGAIGRTANPHRLFALSHLALALFGIGYFAVVPALVVAQGGAALFTVFVGLSAIAALALMLACRAHGKPAGPGECADAAAHAASSATVRGARLERGCRSAIIGIVFMAVNQAMVFSFVQRIGLTRGFGDAHVNAVLIAVGVVNLLPPLLAALLQRKLDARNVALAGPLAQALLAWVISNTTSFAPYALAVSLWVFAMIFTHTFLFGFLARLDTSGRAVAYTPAMLMAGSALGPLLGGALIVRFGLSAIGVAAVLIAALSLLFFSRLRSLAVAQPRFDLPPAG
jgi:predicted MFS family arabinose efflux permease